MGNCLLKPNTQQGETKTTLEATKPTTALRKQSSLHENITVSKNRLHNSIFDYYEKIEHIAQGSTCDVWTIRDRKTKQVYALKIISKDPSSQVFVNEMRNEIAIMRKLDHPNIFRVYEMFESHQHIYMVSEYCSGGDLLSQQLPYSEPLAALVVTKILSAVAFLHRHHIVHRDLKPENVLYDGHGEPKLIDFGLSKRNITRGKTMKCRVGTLVTMSPQVLRGKYSNKSDVWSVGVIAYILLSGKRPFDGKTNKEISRNIVKGEYSMNGNEWENVSQSAKDFIKSLLTYDPDERPPAVEALKDPWLSENALLSIQQPSNESMTRVRNALVQSSRDSKLKRIASMIIAYKSPSESIKELRDVFNALDTNNSGTISMWELRSALKCCNLSDEELMDIFKDIDANDTGMINYTEFLAATLESRGRIEEDLVVDSFERLDTDKTGYLSRSELCSILGKACTVENCDSMVDDIMKELDTSEDGQVSYNEFLVLFREQHRKSMSDQCCQLTNMSQS